MHSALLRRINIQRSEHLSKIGINQKSNFFCIGDSKGFLQVINYPQIEAQTQPSNRDESFSQKQNCFQYISNLKHKGSINLISWNIPYNKLTTVDMEGSLVVWKKKNGIFDIEMVNNREESFLRDVKWSKDGEYICFIYDDGQIYTGLVDGNHEWNTEVDKGLMFVEFSPDNQKILISKKKELIYIFSINGKQIGELKLQKPYNEYEIASIDWWCDYRKFKSHSDEQKNNNNKNIINNNNIINDDGINDNMNENNNNEIDEFSNSNENDFGNFKKHLLIAFKNGILLFFNDENDKEPVMLKTELKKIMGAQWDPKGIYYIVVGNINDSKWDNKSVNNGKSITLFYNLEGELIKKLICPSKIFSYSLGNSTTIALEAQKIIYTGFVKYGYKWTFFLNTIVVGYLIEDNKYNLLYLDIDNNNKFSKIMYGLLGLISNKFFCAIFSENKDKTYNIRFTNNFGNVLETRKCPIKPLYYSMNDEYLVASDGNYIYFLQFRGSNKKMVTEKNSSIMSNLVLSMNIHPATKLDGKLMNEIVFFIEDKNVDINNNDYDYNKFIKKNNFKKSNDKVQALALSTNYLFVFRSLATYKYDISTLKLDNTYKFKEEIKKGGISPFETYLWTIDKDDILRIHNIKYQNDDKENKKIQEFHQKEVWEIEWCQKNEDYRENFTESLNFVTLERNKLYFYSNFQHEGEPYICQDYLAKYIDNEAITIKLEDLIKYKNNSAIKPINYIKKFGNKILSDFYSMLDKNKNYDEIYDYISKNPSRKLWQTLSKNALEKLDFDTAHKSMLQMNDFNGLDFISQVKAIEDPEIQKAEIAQFNSNYDEAAKLYSQSGRTDLNLAMQMKLGKWDKIPDILNKSEKQNPSKNEAMKMAYNNYADELFDKKDYDRAEENYRRSGNIRGLTNCYFAKEDYEKAVNMLEVIPEEEEYLEEMGDKFMEVGMCQEAALAFVKHGNIKKAIESFISCNKWEEAIELSRKNGFIYMEELVDKFSYGFKLSGKKLDLINLYKKANMSVEVNKYLKEIACDMKKIKVPPLIIKKIYVLSALELERYKAQINEQMNEEMPSNIHDNNNKQNVNKANKINYINLALKREIDKIVADHWRGAEAYHFYLLCQRHLHKKKYKESCKTAMRLKFYEDILGTEDVYRLIALTSYLNKCYKFFSDALCVLANDEKIDKIRRLKYKEMGKNFFLKNVPENMEEKFYKCPNTFCDEAISEYDIYCNSCGYTLNGCVLTGISILDNHYFKCRQCRTRTIKSEVKKHPFKHCPLCHISLIEK